MEYLRELLKKDVWNIIDNKQKEVINFESAVLHSLTNSDGFIVGDAITLAEKIRKTYNLVLDDVEKYINNGCVDLITILRGINKDYDNRILPLLEKIKRLSDK